MNNMLSCRNLSKFIGGRLILDNIDVDINSGRITVLMGPSGSGKSTLLRSLSLLDPPDKGTINIGSDNYECKSGRFNGKPPWPDLTVVFQQLFLWPHLSLLMNVALPLKRVHGNNSIIIANDLLNQFGLGNLSERYPNQVSGGQRQLAAICRALALKPKYLLLDEVTSALDVEYISRLAFYLRSLRDTGVTVLVVTHLLGFAERSADNILFMDNGRIVECGGTDLLNMPNTDRFNNFIKIAREAS